MKWLLLYATAAAFPLLGQENPEEVDVDLFKRNDQIYSGSVEFLYWGIAEGGLDYALKMRHAAWGPSPSYAQGRYETAAFHFDPGFRLSLIYFRAPRYWEVKWQYTRLTCRGEDQTSKPSSDQKFITGTWPQIFPNPLAAAKSHLHFNFNEFDMAADRVFFPNPHLRLRMQGAAMLVWMDQDWKVRYVDSTPYSTVIRNQWDFIGGGLKTGTMIDWYWTGDLYMTAAGSFGLLIGNYWNRGKQTTTYAPLSTDNTAVPIRDNSLSDVRPVFTAQILLGPSWQKNYPKNRVELFAGFETNFWFNVQEIYRSTSGGPYEAKETWVNSSIMALYGLTTRLTVDF